MKEAMDWSVASTLKESCIELIKKKQTDSEQFKAILNVFGREKIKQFWIEYLQDQRKQASLMDAIPGVIPDRTSAKVPEQEAESSLASQATRESGLGLDHPSCD